jgi:hypothetical protein
MNVQLGGGPFTYGFDDVWDVTNRITLAFENGQPTQFAQDHLRVACLGDLNCDGQIDFGDINPFVMYLSAFANWQAAFPGCPPQNGDINADGTYGQASFGDINPFVTLLTAGPSPCT